ncbi:hypothetical protein CYJ27_06865 [Aerococcus christensenii]|uniref:Prepilin-type cleavage/methylation protein n=1 Tax=Aerococcus christensenii TaxID=87541 RepID=A0A2I1K5P1_9LACT|nr:type II secretion system protein [Aerococcus christensenii]PKY90973.1 hypothetical protein CYJ27_06865 [Aerococcus christensenii]
MNKGKEGFTLLEMILVLIVVGVKMLVTVKGCQHFKAEFEIRNSVQEITQAYELAQKKAILCGKYYWIDFGHYQVQVRTVSESNARVIERVISLPKGAKIPRGGYIKIHPLTGYIKPTTIDIDYPNGLYSLKIQLGVGKYVLVKK